jgi:hypothetical protein
MARWSDEIKEEARDLRSSGLSIKVIAKQLEVPVGTLHYWVKSIILSQDVLQEIHHAGRVTSVVTRKKNGDLTYNGELQVVDRNDTSYKPFQTGDVSVCKIMAVFIGDGKLVSVPFHQSNKYDLIVDDGVLYRIQCKTARMRTNNTFIFPTCSSMGNNRKKKDRSYVDKADYFAVYLRENDSVYIFKVNNCPLAACTVRFSSVGSCGARLAENHLYVNGKLFQEYN